MQMHQNVESLEIWTLSVQTVWIWQIIQSCNLCHIMRRVYLDQYFECSRRIGLEKSYSSWGNDLATNICDFLPLQRFFMVGWWWMTQYVSRVYQAISSLSATLRRMRRLHWFWEKIFWRSAELHYNLLVRNIRQCDFKSLSYLGDKGKHVQKDKKSAFNKRFANVWQL